MRAWRCQILVKRSYPEGNRPSGQFRNLIANLKPEWLELVVHRYYYFLSCLAVASIKGDSVSPKSDWAWIHFALATLVRSIASFKGLDFLNLTFKISLTRGNHRLSMLRSSDLRNWEQAASPALKLNRIRHQWSQEFDANLFLGLQQIYQNF
jgi:hypothetical protein